MDLFLVPLSIMILFGCKINVKTEPFTKKALEREID